MRRRADPASRAPRQSDRTGPRERRAEACARSRARPTASPMPRAAGKTLRRSASRPCRLQDYAVLCPADLACPTGRVAEPPRQGQRDDEVPDSARAETRPHSVGRLLEPHPHFRPGIEHVACAFHVRREPSVGGEQIVCPVEERPGAPLSSTPQGRRGPRRPARRSGRRTLRRTACTRPAPARPRAGGEILGIGCRPRGGGSRDVRPLSRGAVAGLPRHRPLGGAADPPRRNAESRLTERLSGSALERT